MDYSIETQKLIDRICRNVERKDFELNKKNAEECILKTYDLFDLKRPSQMVWSNDIFGKYNDIAWSAGSAWSARSAGSAGSALDYDFDWFLIEYEYCNNRKDNLGKEPNENDKLYLDYCELLMQAKEYGLGYRIEFEDTLYLVPTPLVLINSKNQFHSSEKPAIRWREGKEFYYLNSVNFPKNLWEKVVSKKMPFEEILAIKDIDQRTQAMKYGDVREFLKHTKSEMLSSALCHNTLYELWKTPKEAGIFTIDAYHCIYSDPMTKLQYMSGIDPKIGEKGDVIECMAWKRNLNKEEFVNAVL